MAQEDFISAIIIQVDNTMAHGLKVHLKTLKDFIASKLGLRSSHNIDLLDQNIKDFYHYNKEEMEKFMFNQWLNMIKNRCLAGRRSSAKDEVLINLIKELQSREINTKKQLKDICIFNNRTTKRSDSYIYIYATSYMETLSSLRTSDKGFLKKK